jgi:hypothetical protein
MKTDLRDYLIDECEAVTDWTVLGNDTVNLATAVNHVWGAKSIEFDKVDGAANTVYAGAYRTVDLDLSKMTPDDFIGLCFYVSDKTDVVAIHVRLGTDASNYFQYTILVAALADGWNHLRFPLMAQSVAGNGGDTGAITYLAVAVQFALETDALADMCIDHIVLKSALIVRNKSL